MPRVQHNVCHMVNIGKKTVLLKNTEYLGVKWQFLPNWSVFPGNFLQYFG